MIIVRTINSKISVLNEEILWDIYTVLMHTLVSLYKSIEDCFPTYVLNKIVDVHKITTKSLVYLI